MTTFRLSDLRSPPAIKREVAKKPVMITEHGSVEYVMMTIGDYNDLLKAAKNESKKRR